jgi:hypothetical protein
VKSKDGRLEERNVGKMEEWNSGIMGRWKIRPFSLLTPSFQHSSHRSNRYLRWFVQKIGNDRRNNDKKLAFLSLLSF